MPAAPARGGRVISVGAPARSGRDRGELGWMLLGVLVLTAVAGLCWRYLWPREVRGRVL
jgi:hypothetical protein